MLQGWERQTGETFTLQNTQQESACHLPTPEAGVVKGVQVRRVRPSDGAAFAAQLHGFPRSHGCGLAQTYEASLIQHLGQQRLAFHWPLLHSRVPQLHPFTPWPDVIVPNVFFPLELLAGT